MAYGYDAVVEAAALAEECGLSSVVVPDHYLMSYDMESGWALPAYEALVQLAGLSRETSSIEIGTLVTPRSTPSSGFHIRLWATFDRLEETLGYLRAFFNTSHPGFDGDHCKLDLGDTEHQGRRVYSTLVPSNTRVSVDEA